MKNFVSFNLKAKNKSEAEDLIRHSHIQKYRKKSSNIVFPEYTKYNISSIPKVLSKYQRITHKIEDIKGRKIQRNANHFLEGVLSFSFEKFKEDPKSFRSKAPFLIEKYMNELCNIYGFTPLGWSLHFDEGHKDINDGTKILNVHAHIQMINYDFKKNKARFREYQQKYVKTRKVPNQHFVAMQDLAGQIFAPLEFVRGLSKEKTNNKHLEKEEYIAKKLKKKESEIIRSKNLISAQKIEIQEKKNYLRKLKKSITLNKIRQLKIKSLVNEEERKIAAFKRSLERLKNEFLVALRKMVNDVKNRNFSNYIREEIKVKNLIDEANKVDKDLGCSISKSANEVAVSLKLGKRFKKN